MQRSVAIDLLARAVGMSPEERAYVETDAMLMQSAVTRIYATFAARVIPYTRRDAEILLELAVTAIRRSRRNGMEWMALELVPQPIAAIERTVRQDGLGDLEVSIQEAAELLGLLEHYDRTKAERYRSRLMALLATDDSPLDPETFDDGDSWGAAWREKVDEIPAALRPLVAQLPLGGGAVTPPLKWQKQVRQLLETPGATDFLRTLLLDVETRPAAGSADRMELPLQRSIPDAFPAPAGPERPPGPRHRLGGGAQRRPLEGGTARRAGREVRHVRAKGQRRARRTHRQHLRGRAGHTWTTRRPSRPWA